MQQPSIGRIVHYADGSRNGVVFAAIITNVRGSGHVDLTYFVPGHTILEAVNSVPLDHDNTTGPRWSWPDISRG